MKSFKRFLREEVDKEFNSFVEEVLTTNRVATQKAKDFLTNNYNYTGLIYRVVFHPRTEIEKYMSEEEINTKGITKYITSKFNHDRYVFFTKSLNGIKGMIEYPNLFKFTEEQVGVVFSIKPAASIDLTKYSGDNIEVKDRLETNEEVLSFEDMNIRNIDALYLYDEGWHFLTDFKNRVHPKFQAKGFKKPENDMEDELESPEDVEQPQINKNMEKPR